MKTLYCTEIILYQYTSKTRGAQEIHAAINGGVQLSAWCTTKYISLKLTLLLIIYICEKGYNQVQNQTLFRCALYLQISCCKCTVGIYQVFGSIYYSLRIRILCRRT